MSRSCSCLFYVQIKQDLTSRTARLRLFNTCRSGSSFPGYCGASGGPSTYRKGAFCRVIPETCFKNPPPDNTGGGLLMAFRRPG